MVLLHEASPYGSREAVVEDDGRTVYLYLVPAKATEPGPDTQTVWIANRLPAPDEPDLASMEAGIAPLMPRSGTRHPEGLPAFQPEALEVVWFQEGDGVALLECGVPLAILPSWSGMGDFHGYAREAIGEEALAWELAPALEALSGRIKRARRYWEWRSEESSWTAIADRGITHLEGRLGPHRRYWAADGGSHPPRAVLTFEPKSCPGISICATVGMSAQPMPGVECVFENAVPHRRVELVLGTTGEPQPLARLLSGMMAMPWLELTWLGDGHTYRVASPNSLPSGQAVLLQSDPPPEHTGGFFRKTIVAPDLSGFVDYLSGDPVTFLWAVPISTVEQQFAQQLGSQTLIPQLQRQKRGWVWPADT